jgi:EF-P beta-lysylation protein EpmB
MNPRADEGDTLAPPGPRASTGGGAAWRRELKEAIRDLDELWRVLALPPEDLSGARAAAAGFPLLVPRGFAALMRRGDAADPLLLQVLPRAAEALDVAGFVADPVGDAAAAADPGLLRKYHGRALLIATGACAVHCRYCFRRHFPYEDLPRGPDRWQDALKAIAADPTIDELILSGGDPLTQPDEALADLSARADAIPHLARLRIHTRLPIVLPARVDEALTAWIARSRLRVVVVVHANHARELSPAVRAACARLRASGALLLNQSVLLAGVNDRVEDLAELSLALGASGVLPYYLHALDPVAGAAHFACADVRGAALIAALADRLPGYLVPRFVREVAGEAAKRPLTP